MKDQEMAAYQFYKQSKSGPKKSGSNKFFTPDEKEIIAEDLRRMKSIVSGDKEFIANVFGVKKKLEAVVSEKKSDDNVDKKKKSKKRKRESIHTSSPIKVAKMEASPSNGKASTAKQANGKATPTNDKTLPAKQKRGKVSPANDETLLVKQSNGKDSPAKQSNGKDSPAKQSNGKDSLVKQSSDKALNVTPEDPPKKSKKNKKRKHKEVICNSYDTTVIPDASVFDETVKILEVPSISEPKSKKTKHGPASKNQWDPSSLGTEPNPDSFVEGKVCLGWMIHPEPVDKFMQDKFCRKIHLIKRGKPDYYSAVFSTKVFDTLLREEKLLFGKNLDVTSYTNFTRETHTPDGIAYPSVVWDFYGNGCSLRLLNPQTFTESVWRICSSLQDFFGSMVGANVYLTPSGTQGFAPHFDDVDVFILQLEGKKRWRLYPTRIESEKDARFSSRNFTQEEIGKPSDDFVLEAGDMVYLPRGCIHQADCLPSTHSLHITISCNQLNTFGDLLMKMLPVALDRAIKSDPIFRESLPHDFYQSSMADNVKRNQLLQKVQDLSKRVVMKYADIETGASELGKRFMKDTLPPYLTYHQKRRCIVSGGDRWDPKTKQVVNQAELAMETKVKLIRRMACWIVKEDGVDKLFYNVENSREFHASEPEPMILEPAQVEILKKLRDAYPGYLAIEDLISDDDDEESVNFIQNLWESKILLTENPVFEETTD